MTAVLRGRSDPLPPATTRWLTPSNAAGWGRASIAPLRSGAEIVFAGNPERGEPLPSDVACRFTNRTDRPVREDPFARGMRQGPPPVMIDSTAVLDARPTYYAQLGACAFLRRFPPTTMSA